MEHITIVYIVIVVIIVIALMSKREGFTANKYSVYGYNGDVFKPILNGPVKVFNPGYSYSTGVKSPKIDSALDNSIKQNVYNQIYDDAMTKFAKYKAEQKKIMESNIQKYYDGLNARTTTSSTMNSMPSMGSMDPMPTISRFTTGSIEQTEQDKYNMLISNYERDLLKYLDTKKTQVFTYGYVLSFI